MCQCVCSAAGTIGTRQSLISRPDIFIFLFIFNVYLCSVHVPLSIPMPFVVIVASLSLLSLVHCRLPKFVFLVPELPLPAKNIASNKPILEFNVWWHQRWYSIFSVMSNVFFILKWSKNTQDSNVNSSTGDLIIATWKSNVQAMLHYITT